MTERLKEGLKETAAVPTYGAAIATSYGRAWKPREEARIQRKAKTSAVL
jgi:hypothetical protein